MSPNSFTLHTTFIESRDLCLLSTISDTVTFGRGPGKRSADCAICLQPINAYQASATHVDCGNAICFDCMLHWISGTAKDLVCRERTNCPPNHQRPRCPHCRGNPACLFCEIYPRDQAPRPRCPFCRGNLDVQPADYHRNVHKPHEATPFIARRIAIRSNRQPSTHFNVIHDELEFQAEARSNVCFHAEPAMQIINKCLKNNIHDLHEAVYREFMDAEQLERQRFLKPKSIAKKLQREATNDTTSISNGQLAERIEFADRVELRSQAIEEEYLWRHYAMGYREYRDLRIPQCPERSFCLVKCPSVLFHRHWVGAKSFLESELGVEVCRKLTHERPVITWHSHHLNELLLNPLINDSRNRIAYRYKDGTSEKGDRVVVRESITVKAFIQDIRDVQERQVGSGHGWHVLPFDNSASTSDTARSAAVGPAVMIFPADYTRYADRGVGTDRDSVWANLGQIAPEGYSQDKERRYIEKIRRQTESWWRAEDEAMGRQLTRNHSATSSTGNRNRDRDGRKDSEEEADADDEGDDGADSTKARRSMSCQI